MTDQTPLRALFDEEYYLSQFRDRAEVGGDPFEHYMSIGWREGRKPHRLLDIAKYIPQYFEIALETTNPLQHYVSNVLPTLASEFDADFYVQSLGEEAEPGVDPLWHYCLHGWREGYDPRPDFSAGAYLDLHPDVRKAGIEPFFHWLTCGRMEGRKSAGSTRHIWTTIAPKFDVKFYLSTQPNLEGSGVDPITHYILHGWREGYDPCPDFSAGGYLRLNPDVKEAEIEPFYHWITVGVEQNRQTLPSMRHMVLAVASRFNVDFYLACQPTLRGSKDDLVQHYIVKGWKEGFDPRPDFSSSGYLKLNPDVAVTGLEPFYHWITTGVAENRKTTPSLFRVKTETRILHENEAKMIISGFFDKNYYLETYEDLSGLDIDLFEHYLEIGWKEGRNPNPEFNTNEYLNLHPDVDASGMDPLTHYALIGKAEGRSLGVFSEFASRIAAQQRPEILSYSNEEIFRRAQDLMFPKEVLLAEKLMLFVVPEHNAMSGGIYSMFSIANHMRRIKLDHGFEIMVATRPNPAKHTYIRNSGFVNSETVYRFEQLELARHVRELYLHIPEYAATEFVRSLSHDMLKYLMRRDKLYVNILNQNIRMMPEREKFRDLRRLTDSLGQSVAHHAYATQGRADRYGLPTLLVPAHTDLTLYAPAPFEEKEKLIIYSPDDAPYKDACLERMQEGLPDYKFIEINEITFDQYMELATRCKFSVSFGEGFDGYVAQPIYQGGIGFAVYTDEFFPSDKFLQFENFFASEQLMINNIVSVVRELEGDHSRYTRLNAALHAEWENLYRYSEYLVQLKRLAFRQYEIFPAPSYNAASSSERNGSKSAKAFSHSSGSTAADPAASYEAASSSKRNGSKSA